MPTFVYMYVCMCNIYTNQMHTHSRFFLLVSINYTTLLESEEVKISSSGHWETKTRVYTKGISDYYEEKPFFSILDSLLLYKFAW